MDDDTDTQRPPGTSTSWQVHLAVAALSGVVTAYLPVHRWPRRAQWALHGGLGAMTTGAMGYVLSRPEEPDGANDEASSDDATDTALAVGLSVLAGLTAAGISRGGQAADGWIERQLRARGVRRPRMWLGLAAAGASLVTSPSENRTSVAQISPGSVGGGGAPGAGG